VENVRQIRVLVVDDHGLMVEAVRLALDRERDIEIVGGVGAGRQVIPAVVLTRPEIVLLDIGMPEVDGLEVLDRLHAEHPEVKVVMLTGVSDSAVARDAIRRGAAAYVDKRVDPATLATTLRKVAVGTIPPPLFAASTEAHAPQLPALSTREREILTRVAAGRSNREIAGELWLSEQTVKYHLTNVYRKLGVKGRTGAIRFAFDHGILDPGVPVGAPESARRFG
jgi:DNA-binding NarL/FixJ family response regulator